MGFLLATTIRLADVTPLELVPAEENAT